MFAVAVVLFVMYSKTPPFTQKASSKDPLYRLIAQHKMDKFWEAHEATKPKGFYSKEFKDLLSCMFQYQPHMRLTMADFVGNAWMMGEMATEEEVFVEMTKR